eukprot:CAMPEP_0115031506 /NCGR_PEP_ID=MMETSP0216-20121206/38583_1 /TAXON_ID=223996 /ORGANISM="Protocruzia adherens, Strain Boccale" /LENGTH=334 /DNA_ID=CAMNT_0002409187 /DNA_START=62 /DNA_END=1066 /DNA_ORIENTATION=+
MGKEKVEDEIVFDRTPILFTCHYCSSRVTTTVEFEYNIVSAFVFFGTLYILTPLQALIMLPIVVPLTKSSVHKCPNCFEELGSKKCLGVPNFDDEVLSFNFGDCAVVLSRKSLCIVLAVLAVVLYYTYIPPHVGYDHAGKNHRKTLKTWEEFKTDCGADIILENRVKAALNFDENYHHNTVTWDGYIVKKLKGNDKGPWGQNDHSMTLLVKMMPTDSSYPDLAISYGTQIVKENKTVFDSLDKGDHIEFEAIFMALQSESNLNHLHGHTIKKLPGRWALEGVNLASKHDSAHDYYEQNIQESPQPSASTSASAPEGSESEKVNQSESQQQSSQG